MTAAGLYVHIPFCSSRCSYCDFATGLYQRELARPVRSRADHRDKIVALSREHTDTIYFGGGTPSLLTPSQLDRILATLHDHFAIDPAPEITLEINPGSVNEEKLRAFRSPGINQASFGAQTFDDKELAKLGRSHSVADTLKTFADLRRAGFNNVSFDLIAGLPGKRLPDGSETSNKRSTCVPNISRSTCSRSIKAHRSRNTFDAEFSPSLTTIWRV